jgi:hypothetical protein
VLLFEKQKLVLPLRPLWEKGDQKMLKEVVLIPIAAVLRGRCGADKKLKKICRHLVEYQKQLYLCVPLWKKH